MAEREVLLTAPKLEAPNVSDMACQTGIYIEGPSHERLIEQIEYLNGVLHTDDDLRLADDPSVANAVDPYGNGTAAFWRGFTEGAGNFQIIAHDRSSTMPRFPRFRLRASWHLLSKFTAWCLQQCAGNLGRLNLADLPEMCSRGEISYTGPRAQRIVTWLYTDAWIAAPSKRRKAEDIMRWSRQ